MEEAGSCLIEIGLLAVFYVCDRNGATDDKGCVGARLVC